MLEQFLFTVGYVAIIGVVAGFYHTVGYKRGVTDTLLSMKHFEPEAYQRALLKMQKELNLNARSDG